MTNGPSEMAVRSLDATRVGSQKAPGSVWQRAWCCLRLLGGYGPVQTGNMGNGPADPEKRYLRCREVSLLGDTNSSATSTRRDPAILTSVPTVTFFCAASMRCQCDRSIPAADDARSSVNPAASRNWRMRKPSRRNTAACSGGQGDEAGVRGTGAPLAYAAPKRSLAAYNTKWYTRARLVMKIDAPDDGVRLRELLARFGDSPADPGVPTLARELAARHTLDQLEAMATGQRDEVRALFERVLGRAGL